MGDFSTTWLALREPADSRARSTHLLRSLQARLSTCECPPGAEAASPQLLRILDLGCGTGANLRYLAPRLGLELGAGPWARQDWICVDRDRRLLADLTHRTADWARGRNLTASVQGEGLFIQGVPDGLASGSQCRVRTLDRDLARGSESLLLGPGTLVVASALLDLVSADWLAGLLRACARSGSHLFLALTYDGRVGLCPDHPHDGTLLALVNAHQGRDKGLGPALGPSAPPGWRNWRRAWASPWKAPTVIGCWGRTSRNSRRPWSPAGRSPPGSSYRPARGQKVWGRRLTAGTRAARPRSPPDCCMSAWATGMPCCRRSGGARKQAAQGWSRAGLLRANPTLYVLFREIVRETR
jgi:SAM-dependent methyltransferase